MIVGLEGPGVTKSNNSDSINTFSTSLRWAPAMAMVAGAVYTMEDVRRKEGSKSVQNDKNLEKLTVVQEYEDHFNQIEYASSTDISYRGLVPFKGFHPKIR